MTSDEHAERATFVERAEQLEKDLMLVIDLHSLTTEPPPFHRDRVVHALIDLAGKVMQVAISEGGEPARRRMLIMVRDLALLIAPSKGRAQ